MPIKRRTPEVDSIIANRLKSIDSFGQPQGAEGMEEARYFVHYGWVDPDLWELTEYGRTVMNEYFAQRAADRARVTKEERPNARDVYHAERMALGKAVQSSARE